MESKDDQGTGLMKKPTGILSYSPLVKDQLEKKCLGGHRHVALMGRRAKTCQNYPDKLCRAMLRRVKSALVHSGMLSGKDSDMLMVSVDEWDEQQ